MKNKRIAQVIESLEQINWKALHHAYGSAEDVPQLLRALASNDNADRTEAYNKLYGNIWHQGTIYEATAYAVPFLIELLNISDVKDKDAIVYFLQAIGTGGSYHEDHASSFYEEKHSPEFQKKLNQELLWVKNVYLATVDGLPTYLQLLTCPDKQVRRVVPYLLAIFTDKIAPIKTALLKQIALEQDAVAKASMLLSASELEQHIAQHEGKSDLGFLLENVENSQESEIVQFSSALALIQLDLHAHYASAMPVLHRTIGKVDESYTLLPWQQEANTPIEAVYALLESVPNLQLQWLIQLIQREEPFLRSAALWKMQDLIVRWRPALAHGLPFLTSALDDTETEVQEAATITLAMCGRVGREILNSLQNSDRDKNHVVNLIISKRAQHFLAIDLPKYVNDYRTMKYQKILSGSPSQLIRIIEDRLAPPFKDDTLLQNAIFTLVSQGEKMAREVLLKALQFKYRDERLFAAWGLWKLEGNVAETLPILIEELNSPKSWPLVLQCLDEMGEKAQFALPILQKFVDSEFRITSGVPRELLVEFDDLLQAAAQQTIAKITARI